MQLGRTDPFASFDTIRPWFLSSNRVAKAPTTGMRQSGEICQAFCTEAFTSFCQPFDETPSFDLRTHHCLLSSHVAEDCTVFTSSICADGCLRDCLLGVSRLLGLTLRRWKPALAQEATHGIYFVFPFVFVFLWTAKCPTEF